jgi:predicted transcriptional regulator
MAKSKGKGKGKAKGKAKVDKKMAETLEALSSAGMPKGIARTLAFLTTAPDWATSKDIEKGTNLRQPEVSIAVRDLFSRGWVARDTLKRESKGRPICIYKMEVDLSKVYKSIEASEREKIDAIEANLKKVRDLWGLK